MGDPSDSLSPNKAQSNQNTAAMATKNKKRRYLSVASNDGTSPKKTAVTQLVPNPFDPRTSGPPLPVPLDKGSPENLSVASNDGTSPKKTKAAMMTSPECPVCLEVPRVGS